MHIEYPEFDTVFYCVLRFLHLPFRTQQSWKTGVKF